MDLNTNIKARTGNSADDRLAAVQVDKATTSAKIVVKVTRQQKNDLIGPITSDLDILAFLTASSGNVSDSAFLIEYTFKRFEADGLKTAC